MEMRSVTIEYPHWDEGEHITVKPELCGRPFTAGQTYEVFRTNPPTSYSPPQLFLKGYTVALNPQIVLPAPALITDAERVRAACRVEFYGVQTLGGHWFSVTDSPINSRFPSTQDAKSALEALDCWVMELRRRDGKQ